MLIATPAAAAAALGSPQPVSDYSPLLYCAAAAAVVL